MKPITVTTTIDRPREEVFDHLDVLANHEAFCDHFMVDWEVSGPPRGVGGKLRAKVKAPGRTEPFELEVVDVRRPSLVGEQSVGAGGKRRMRGTYYLEEAGSDRTDVRFELVTEAVPFVERLTGPLARPWMVKQNRIAMARLKEQMER